MRKKRVKKKALRISVFGTISIIGICLLFFNVFRYAYSIMKLKKETATLEEQLLSLKETEQELKLEIQKLQDPEYIARYARENYLYSKDGEYIIKIEKEDTEEEVKTNSIEEYYPYLIVGGGIFLLIILYIVKKSKKK